MKNTRLLILALVIVFGACKKKDSIRVIERNFDKEVLVTGNLSFTFNKELVNDSLVNLWIDDELMDIKPDVQGRYMWVAGNKLVFQPESGFRPSTDYTCELSRKIFKNVPDLSYTGDKSFEFHTPYLKINDIRAYWSAPETGEGAPVVRLDIEFNQNVKAAEVADLLNVAVDKENRDFSLVSEETGNSVAIVVRGIKAEDKDFAATVTIDKGLTADMGTVKTDKPVIQELDIPSPFKLEISDLQANHDGSEGIISIYTTQSVNEKNIKDFIRITPWIKYDAEVMPNYINIKSEEFDLNSKYDITIKKGLEGKIGGKLKYDYSQPVSFGQLQPGIRFVDKKEFYVSGKGSRNIKVAIVNVPEVNVKITKIFENNILKYIQNYSFSNYDDYYDDYYYDYYYYDRTDPAELGDVVYEEDIESKELQRYGNSRLLTLDFEDKLSQYKGIYVIEVRSTRDYWLRDEKLVSISDIGLIVKEGKNNITVFANSLQTAQPVPDAEITFIGRNNQVAHTAKTNTEGVVTYEYSELAAPGFKPYLVTADYKGDYNFVPFRSTRVSTSRFDVGGNRENPAGLETFIYGDRDIYRPGETINVTAIIRDYNWNTPEQIPVVLEITTPRGKTLKKIKKILNSHGSFETSIKLSASAMTGSYTAGIYTSNKVFIGSGIIRVEEFVPDRIKVDVSLNKDECKPGDELELDIQAVNFFGPPAANRNYQVEMSVKRKYFHPKENRDYNYSITGAETYFKRIYRDAKTNEQGKATELFDIPTSYKNMGILQSDFYITVFDETGRPVNRLKNVDILTQDVFYGIKYSQYYTKTGQPVKFDLIAVDKTGKALTDVDAELQLIKHEYKTVLSRSGNYFKYRSEKVEKVIAKKQMTINGTSSSYSFIPDLSGRYELRVSAPKAITYVSRTVYAYGWGRTSFSSFEVNNEGQIDIQLDKDKYLAGDKAKVILKAPFSGKILVTIENNKVLDHFYIETDKRAASFEIDIKEDYIPNAYITATLFRPHRKSDLPLTVAHGFAPVMVENPATRMDIEIKAAESSRSNKKQKIKIVSEPNCALTVAVVDEGILQVTGFRTPDPHGFFYRKRALEVNSYDVYPFLFPEVEMVRSHTGGGGPAEEKRVNPLTSKRIKLVTFWSGLLETNSRGEAEYEIDIPEFSGDLRIMAVTYKGKTFGSGFANMKVADPVVISTALPRFLSPQDSAEVPVILTNTTEKTASCKTKLTVSGPLKITGKSSQTVRISSNSEKEVQFKVYAKPQTGQASITVDVQALGEQFTNTTDITVRPAAPLQKRSGSGVISAGSTKKIAMKSGDFIESSIDNKLVVSKNPLVQFTRSLDYLVRYPYGCIEQTVSTAFPQLYFSEMVNNIFSEERAVPDAAQNVQYALDKVRLMQLYNGGLTFWPGGGSETWWGSVYAAHFAVEAKKAGYDVDEEFLDRLLKYLKTRLKKKETINYYYNETKKRKIAPKEVPYSLYVLALAGEKQMSTMNYYKARPDQLSLDGKYLLGASYALTGDKKKYREILPSSFTGEKSNKTFGGSFYSYVRDEALALNTLLEVEPDNPQIGIMAKHVSESLTKRRYLNTQERVFGFLAMGKLAKIAAESDVSAVIKSKGKTVGQYKNSTVTLNTADLKGIDIEIVTEGKGKLYYFWECEGISATGKYIEEDNFIKVRKRFYDRNGNLATGNIFEQNNLVLVEISLENGTNTRIDNIVISDILPAGFEIENPRLTTLPPGMKWPNRKSHPVYQDIRDDRINMFVNLYSYNYNKPQYYYYLVRAVSRGTFKMGPVGADAMYNGEYHSYNGGGVVKITK